MTKHTPGPWRYEGAINKHDHSSDIRDSSGAAPVATAVDFNRYDRDEEREANARLIAAAPEMLEALKQCVGMLRILNNKDELIEEKNARALIAKVEGDR